MEQVLSLTFLVNFAPATARDDDPHNGSDDCPCHRECRYNNAIWYKLPLIRAGSGGYTNSEPHTCTSRKTYQRVPAAVAWFLYRYGRYLLPVEHLLPFPGGHRQSVIGSSADFAPNRAGAGRDPDVRSRCECLDGIPSPGCLGGRGHRRQSKQRSQAADKPECSHHGQLNIARPVRWPYDNSRRCGT